MYWNINFSNSIFAAWVCNIIIIIIFKCAATVLSRFSIASQQEHWEKRVNILPELWFTDGFSLHAVHCPHFCINGLFSSTFCTLLTKSEIVALRETAVLQYIKQWLKWLILGKAQWYLWKETGDSKANSEPIEQRWHICLYPKCSQILRATSLALADVLNVDSVHFSL